MESTSFFDVWPVIFLIDMLRYLIPASIAFILFWVIGKNWWRHLFIQTEFPKSIQLWKEIAYSMSTVVIFSLVGFGLFSAKRAGLTMIYDRLEEHSITYLMLSLVVMIVFHDFYFYWTHRFMHHPTVFKYVHKVHHESTNPSPWAAYAFHPWEAIVQAMVLPILVFTIPLHPIVITIFLLYMIVRNVVGHLGFEILPRGFTKNKWLNWNTAITHHNLHHRYFNRNYGLYFSWWDNIMKTTHEKYHETFEEVTSRPKSCAIKARKQKSATVSIVVLFIFSTSAAQSVSGVWTTYNEVTGSPLSSIEIRQVGNSIEGRVTEIFLEPYQGEDPVCTKCPGDKKGRKVIGMDFLWGFKREDDAWSSGKILDPESGDLYTCSLWMEDKTTLKVRGYAGPFHLFYRTQTWKRDGTSNGATPEGTWQTIDDHWNKVKSLVEIKDVGGELRGYIRKIYLLPHEGKDPVCTQCKGEIRNSKIVGMKILWGFTVNKDKWSNGKILDPGNGSIYESSIWLLDKDTLNVRGYLGPFYRSQVWKRHGT